MNLHQIDLDIALEGFLAGELELANILEVKDIKFELINHHGAAGGNSVIRFTGTKEALVLYIDNFYAPGEDNSHLYEDIVPVTTIKVDMSIETINALIKLLFNLSINDMKLKGTLADEQARLLADSPNDLHTILRNKIKQWKVN